MMSLAESPSTDDLNIKKGRHRHSPAQLVALNELFDRDEHPSLEVRTSLAESLGMETKTVNAWFQNKRASLRRKTTMQAQTSPSTDYQLDDYIDDEEDFKTWFSPENPERSHSPMPNRIRIRPTAEQSEQLRQLYLVNQHPSASERQALADRIGMRYSSITNWFQNQRSLSKKRKEDDADLSFTDPHSGTESRMYSAFPPLPPSSTHPSLTKYRRSQSVSSSPADEASMRRSIPRRSATPYGPTVSPPRPKRSRPEPYQLDALKQLYEQTTTPSIEDRTALAQKIGMDVAKVTNWFRNSRQTDRKRQKKAGSGDDDDYEDPHLYPRSQLSSRAHSPSFHSSSSSHHSDFEETVAPNASHSTDEEYQEAVTPSPESSPPPEPKPVESISLALVNAALYPSSLIADAQLLLDFHRHAVH